MRNSYFQEDVEELKVKGRYRSLKEISSPQGREIILNGQEVLNFCSNDYLGLANDARIKEAAILSIKRDGFGTGASRLVCGNTSSHQRLEEKLAQFKKTESALVFSSGYMANVGIISALLNREDTVFSDRLNHASIIDGIILSRAKLKRYAHGDMQALEEVLKNTELQGRRLIVTDTVFSMDGDVAPLKEIVDLARRYEAMVMVDEAHAFGVLGFHGGGLVEELGLGSAIDVQMGTLSKSAGCFGAYACGAQSLIEFLINHSRSFIYTTALPALMAEASFQALELIENGSSLRAKVLSNAQYLRQGLQQMGYDTLNSTTPIIPIVVKDDLRATAMSSQLLELGIFVQAIRPPTVPEGTARLRLTTTALHTQNDLDKFLKAMKSL